MAYDRLSPMDASFLSVEDDVRRMHLGAVCVFAGPPPAYDEVVATVEGKLHLVPRFRQVIRTVPAGMGRPVWIDDPHFNLEYHLRQAALPAPGGLEALWSLVGRIMSQRLDRTRPLWEYWLVEGIGEGRWALVSKTHHSLVDGASGIDMLAVMLDVTPHAQASRARSWVPRPEPSALRLAAGAAAATMTSPLEQLRVLGAATRVPRQAADQAAGIARSLWEAAGIIARPAPRTSLNGPTGPHRRWMTTRTRVANIKAAHRALGGSFNDVLLAAVTRGYRDLLLSRGESVAHDLRALVPVSVQARRRAGHPDANRLSTLAPVFTSLPVGLADPVERLHAIAVQTEDVKSSHHALAGEALTGLSGFAPPVLLALASRAASRLPQVAVNTVVTNVPGPQLPLFACGRHMIEAYAFAPLGVNLRTAVGIFSYDGTVTFAVTADRETTADLRVLVAGIDAGLAEMAQATSERVTLDLTSPLPMLRPLPSPRAQARP